MRLKFLNKKFIFFAIILISIFLVVLYFKYFKKEKLKEECEENYYCKKLEVLKNLDKIDCREEEFYCKEIYAEKRKDITLCQTYICKIKNLLFSNLYECKNAFSEGTEISLICDAIYYKNISLCYLIQYENFREVCLSNFIKINCSSDDCFLFQAIKYNDIESCKKIRSEELMYDCIYYLNPNYNCNKEICKILSEYYKSQISNI